MHSGHWELALLFLLLWIEEFLFEWWRLTFVVWNLAVWSNHWLFIQWLGSLWPFFKLFFLVVCTILAQNSTLWLLKVFITVGFMRILRWSCISNRVVLNNLWRCYLAFGNRNRKHPSKCLPSLTIRFKNITFLVTLLWLAEVLVCWLHLFGLRILVFERWFVNGVEDDGILVFVRKRSLN